MGYTHYWYRELELDAGRFTTASMGCGEICSELSIPLAGSEGKGEPKFLPDVVAFNGVEDCGHPERDPRDGGAGWPSEDAKGTANGFEDVESGKWLAGPLLTKRTCTCGNCSHESLYIGQIEEQPEWDEGKPLIRAFCKTSFKPYDLAVQVCLIVFQHHFQKSFFVKSDGKEPAWDEPRAACQALLGYGADFKLSDHK